MHDRLAVGERLVSLADYLEDTLLTSFGVVLSYDLGNGLTIERGGELVAEVAGRRAQAAAARAAAGHPVDRAATCATSATCARSAASEKTPNVAVIVRGVDQIVPADGAGFEHGSLTSMLRDWACESPFSDLPFTSLLIADNLNDVEPLVASAAHAVRIRVPLPDAAALERALAILAQAAPEGLRAGRRTCRSSPARSPASRSRASRAW